MPTYDYRCDHCGHAFSAVQSFSDEALEVCPSCGKKPRRLISMPAIVFKGSGWYKTDSRAPAPSSDGGSAKGAKKGDTADKPGTTDKPATGEKPGTTGTGDSVKKSDGGAKTDAASSTTTDKGTGAGPAGSGGATSSGGGSGGSGG